MKKHHDLTNEKLRGRFKSQFELVNYAIGVAKNLIESGHHHESTAYYENYANEILEKISDGDDILTHIEESPEETVVEEAVEETSDEEGSSDQSKEFEEVV